MRRLTTTRLADATLERVRQEHASAIGELQALPAVTMRIIPDVTLADGVETPVPHGLGRPAQWVRESCVRGAAASGRVEEIRNGTHDRKLYVVLKATGWGATITASVAVL